MQHAQDERCPFWVNYQNVEPIGDMDRLCDAEEATQTIRAVNADADSCPALLDALRLIWWAMGELDGNVMIVGQTPG